MCNNCDHQQQYLQPGQKPSCPSCNSNHKEETQKQNQYSKQPGQE